MQLQLNLEKEKIQQYCDNVDLSNKIRKYYLKNSNQNENILRHFKQLESKSNVISNFDDLNNISKPSSDIHATIKNIFN